MMQRIGQVVGNYRVTEEIKTGTFGAVYKAEHTILTNRTVAIKFLHANYLHSQQDQALFIQEAQLLEELKHPFILPIHDVGIFHDGCPYIIMKLASKGSLRDRLNDKAHLLSEKEILAILSQIGEALQYIHQQKIVHRDLKPDNILFDEQGNAILADFGIAYMMATLRTHMAGGPGTPAYMAPEQSQKQASFKSDQYALGCIAYELFTGQRPFTADNHIAMAYQHSQEKPTPPTVLKPNLSQHIERAILKAMAKQTDGRYSDVSAFIQALSVPFLAPTVISPTVSSTTLTSTVTGPTIELVTWPTTLAPGMVLGECFEILEKIREFKYDSHTIYRVRNINMPSVEYIMDFVRVHESNDLQGTEDKIRKEIQSLGYYPGIPRIIRVCKSRGDHIYWHNEFKCTFYVIRELFEGLNLLETIKNQNTCIEELAINIVLQCCDILQHCNIINIPFHISPESFTVTSEDKVKLLSHSIFIKWRYEFYPRTIRGLKYDLGVISGCGWWYDYNIGGSTDISYMLGATLFFLLTGEEPDKNPQPGDLQSKNSNLRIIHSNNATICPVEQLVIKAMHQDRQRRFRNIQAMKNALSYCLAN